MVPQILKTSRCSHQIPKMLHFPILEFKVSRFRISNCRLSEVVVSDFRDFDWSKVHVPGVRNCGVQFMDSCFFFIRTSDILFVRLRSYEFRFSNFRVYDWSEFDFRIAWLLKFQIPEHSNSECRKIKIHNPKESTECFLDVPFQMTCLKLPFNMPCLSYLFKVLVQVTCLNYMFKLPW